MSDLIFTDSLHSQANRLHDSQQRSNLSALPLMDTTPTIQFHQQLQPQYTAMVLRFISFNPYYQQTQQKTMEQHYILQQQGWMRQQQEAQVVQLGSNYNLKSSHRYLHHFRSCFTRARSFAYHPMQRWKRQV